MAINLHTKYAAAIEQAFTLGSLVKGKSSNRFSFTGVRTIRLQSVTTQALADYSRTTGFPTAAEVQDTIQDFTLSQEKAFNMRIDALNASDQEAIKAAGPILKAEMDEQVIPTSDKHALKQLALYGGKSVVLGAATSKSNIIEYLLAARTHFTDSLVPEMGRYAFLNSADYAFVLQSPEFIAGVTGLGEKAVNGVAGKACGFWIVETPSSYLFTDIRFIVAHESAWINPEKVHEVRIINSESFLGKLLQGVFYYDAFVVGQKANGIYVGIKNGSSIKVAKPTATQGAVNKDEYTLASATAGSTIKYTLDGSDPRYSSTAVSVATGTVITLTAAVTGAKFVALKADMVTSDVLTQDCPIV